MYHSANRKEIGAMRTLTVEVSDQAFERLEKAQLAMGKGVGKRKVTQSAAVDAILLDGHDAAWWANHYRPTMTGRETELDER